jgi:glycine/D-amino acid oxidase-like deaminating enzyme
MRRRDGENSSLWEGNSDPYQPVNSGGWNEHIIYDVLVVGGGVTGLTTSVLLQKAGYRCILADAQTIGFGTSLGTTAHLNTLMDTSYPEIERKFGKKEARLVAEGSARAVDLVETLCEEIRTDCGFSREAAWLVAETEDEVSELGEI